MPFSDHNDWSSASKTMLITISNVIFGVISNTNVKNHLHSVPMLSSSSSKNLQQQQAIATTKRKGVMLSMVLIVDVLLFLLLMLLKSPSYYCEWVFYDSTSVDNHVSVNAGFEHCHGCITSDNLIKRP